MLSSQHLIPIIINNVSKEAARMGCFLNHFFYSGIKMFFVEFFYQRTSLKCASANQLHSTSLFWVFHHIDTAVNAFLQRLHMGDDTNHTA